MNHLEISGLSKSFGSRGEVKAIDHVDLLVKEGELVVLLGPSGCGKTTLLRCVAGLEKPTSGRITIGGKTAYDRQTAINAPPNHRDIGMVFQNFALWPHLSVGQNVRYPLKARKKSHLLNTDRVGEVLDSVQCRHLIDRIPAQLSGGQQQRVSLARALASEPSVMLLDEPLSSLDALLRTDLRRELRRLHNSVKFTGIYVTHDQREALELGDRIVVMRSGSIEQMGSPREVFERPISTYVASFLGASNKLPLILSEGKVRVGNMTVQGNVAVDFSRPESRWELLMRPEMLEIGPVESNSGGMEGRLQIGIAEVVDVGYGGVQWDCTVRFGGQNLQVVTPIWSFQPRVGEKVYLTCAPSGALLYENDRLVEPTGPSQTAKAAA